MNNSLLSKVYDPQKFKEFGYELIDIITEHLSNSQEEKIKVNNWLEPNEQLTFCTFAEKISLNDNFELALQPHSNIVCFRYKEKGKLGSKLNEINNSIRKSLLLDGEFYIVQTALNGLVYLRVTFMNTKTTEDTMDLLLAKIEKIAGKIAVTNMV